MIVNLFASSTPLLTSALKLISDKQPNTQETEFAKILEKAQKGETLSTQEIFSWEKHRENSGAPYLQPDEVDEAGMIKGFQPTFPKGFPSDLQGRLERMWGKCHGSDEKFKFMEMFQLNFESDPGKIFNRYNDTSWRDSVKEGVQYAKSVVSTSIGEEKEDESNIVKLLKDLLC
jgi:hypothetical protein